MRLSSAQVLGLDGVFGPVEESGLGVGPLLAAVQPLEAVVVEVAPEGDPRREGAVAEDCERAETRDLVHVADDQDVALGGGLGAG